MKPGRIAAIVIRVVLAVPALVGGAALTVGYATERDDGGYFDATLERLSTPTAAITTGEADLRADPGPPDRVLDFVDFSVRIQATDGSGRSSAQSGSSASSYCVCALVWWR